MGLFSKDIQTMEDLLLHGLKDIYYAENQIVKSLPKMIDKATNRDLTKGLHDHLEETKNQIARLDQVFNKLGQEPKGVKCPAIDGLISEADEVAGEVSDKEVLDAAIIGAAQSVEYYEIARYGTLIAWAEAVGHDDRAAGSVKAKGSLERFRRRAHQGTLLLAGRPETKRKRPATLSHGVTAQHVARRCSHRRPARDHAGCQPDRHATPRDHRNRHRTRAAEPAFPATGRRGQPAHGQPTAIAKASFKPRNGTVTPVPT